MLFLFTFLTTLGFAFHASAYVGPGVALGLVGYLFGFVGIIAVSIFLVLLYPGLKLYRWVKARKKPN
jgi:hypothetical protein